MKILVIGAGYVGLVTAVSLALKNHFVVLLDSNASKIERLEKRIVPFYEKLLESRYVQSRVSGNLTLQTLEDKPPHDCEVILICVGTPNKGDKIDLSYVAEACKYSAGLIKISSLPVTVTIKSTVVPGTTDTFVREILEEKTGWSVDINRFGLAMNPEFLREGSAVEDSENPDRIVIGVENQIAEDTLMSLYGEWNVPKLVVSSRTAEFIKYANNSLLAVQISAANELARIAENSGGVDYIDVLKGLISDFRWNAVAQDGCRVPAPIQAYMSPGPGFGGSCFPKDVRALVSYAKDLGVESLLFNAVLNINETQVNDIVLKVLRELSNENDGGVLLLGLSFKPDSDDVRESRSISIAKELSNYGVAVTVHDPVVRLDQLDSSLRSKVSWAQNWKVAVKTHQVVVVATPWEEYFMLPKLIVGHKVPKVYDLRRAFKKSDFPKEIYRGVGLNRDGFK